MSNPEGINVLSLFNGMGCIWLALDKLGVDVNKRYSSEIDKYAIKVNDANYPDTVQLGDVTKVQGEHLEKIDLLVGGSPCQGFSSAGKGLNFDDPRSKLFFEFVRLLKECNPRWFLLENVGMKKEHEDVITEILGVQPQKINSSLFSAQSRVRLYWTNLPVVALPEDKQFLISDIVDPKVSIDTHPHLFVGDDKTFIPVTHHKSRNGLKCLGGLLGPDATLWGTGEAVSSSNIKEPYRVYDAAGKWPALTTRARHTGFVCFNSCMRRLSRVEIERLQTVPDSYTAAVSRTQATKMLGNGWTVDVIAHLLQPMACEIMIDDALTLQTD